MDRETHDGKYLTASGLDVSLTSCTHEGEQVKTGAQSSTSAEAWSQVCKTYVATHVKKKTFACTLQLQPHTQSVAVAECKSKPIRGTWRQTREEIE